MAISYNKFILSLFVLLFSNISIAQNTNLLILPDTTYEITDPDFELLMAATEEDTSKVKALLETGTDVNTATYDGVTPLMYAAQNGHLRAVEILIDSGAKVNILPYNQVSALMGACIAGHVMVADTLILNGADVNTKNTDLVTPLMYAAAFDNFILTDVLIFYGADVNQKDLRGNTALLHAVYYNNLEITDLLLEYGANIDTTDNNGFTPLMVAAQNGYLQHVDYLIYKGANIDAENENNLTALSLAIINRNYEIARLLLDNGANVNHSISKARNQMSIAMEFCGKHIRQLLMEYGADKNPKPRIDKLLIGADFNGNINDFMTGGNVCLNESKYGLQLQLGYKTRPWVRSVLYEVDEKTFYQFWEKRSCANLGLDKLFVLQRSSLKNYGGIFIGVNGVYTYGNFRGSDKKPENRFLVVPEAGFFWNYKKLSFKLNYEYMKLKNTKVSSHRINLSVGFIINIAKDKIKLKKEPEL
ncbi:MAG: ankyrin repeat domain-containing protein [Bacteroidetes bacterium]|nr:ankyrin repeat domain-containing protein [Bacteroidota bacterium]MBL7103101.1 ankyrin repeat domain-containing protein [Bacteroidales bacterium]